MQKSSKSPVMASCCPIALWSKTRQISGLGRGAHAVSMSCCPIEVSEFKESEAIPNNASNDGEEAGKTVRPLALESDKSKQHIKQHGRPKLPAYGMLGVAKEVAYFEGLLDLLEEGFDTPAASIQIADTRSSPVEVIGQENHGGPFAVDLDPGFDSAQAFRILPTGLVSDQSDLVVADDITFGSFQTFSADTVAEVILGAGDPEDAAFGEVEEVGEMDVSLVEHGDLSDLEPGAELHGAGVVMVGSFFNDGKGRKESLQVQAQMHLRSRLAAAVLGPVHAVGHKSDGRRIDGMDRPLEAAGQTTVTTGWAEARVQRLKVSEDAPKSSSIMSLLRCLLACESVLRLGATAPRIAPSLDPWCRRLSHTSFSPIACVNCANRRLTTWLHGVKVRDFLSTPCLRASFCVKCDGMILQS